MRIVLELRERRSRPKLNEVIKLYKENLQNEKYKSRESTKKRFQEKFIKLYENIDPIEEKAVEDVKFKTLVETLTRIKYQLGGQQVALSNLVMRVNNLMERK